MEPLADAGGFLLLRANLARNRKGGMPCRNGHRTAIRQTGTGTRALKAGRERPRHPAYGEPLGLGGSQGERRTLPEEG